MARSMLPGTKFRSQTAAQNIGDICDKVIYSSIVAGHGGGAPAKAFTVPQGQAIARMMGSGIAPTEAHHLIHDYHSTNMEKAAEVAGSIGSAAVRGISVQLEVAKPLPATLFGTFGATPQDVCDFLSKVFCQFRIGGKDMISGPVTIFPSQGGPNGSTSIAVGPLFTGSMTNGSNISAGQGRRLKIPIQVDQTDIISMVFQGGNGATLVFAVTSGVGQATLVTTLLSAFTRGEVR